MRDSFFTAQNDVDRQLKQSSSSMANEVLEAGARRLAAIEGPLGAAVRLQRLADICAVAHVLPIEHWRKAPEEKIDKPEPKKLTDRIFAATAAHGHWFVAGMLFDMVAGAIIRVIVP